MDNWEAMMNGIIYRNCELMVFDWDKAAILIKESGCQEADAGLEGDWGCTAGTIFKDGAPTTDDYTYLASTWATPQLAVNGELIDCYKMENETPGWDAHTKWPESALNILNT